MVFAFNAVLLAGHAVVYAFTGSQLVLAQGADSLLDLVAGLILTISASVGSQPRDPGHPFGHQRAEPIGALVTAVLAGVLAVEVGRSAVTSLLSGAEGRMDASVASILGLKLAVKAGLLVVITRRLRQAKSSALRATQIDTRNDLVATFSSLAGFALVQVGHPWADAGLALPVAAYIAYNGIDLARENLRYLMGEAPSDAVHRELLALARAVPGNHTIHSLRAHYVGQMLHVEVVARVPAGLSGREVHDLSVDLEQAVGSHELVNEAFVHCDPPGGKDHGDEEAEQET